MKNSTDIPQQDDVRSVDDVLFSNNLASILRESEEFRLKKMAQHRSREFISTTSIICLTVLGAGGFAWFFLINGNIAIALLCMIIAIAPYFLLNKWAKLPVTEYKREYKTKFMPRIADALGGLKFFPNKGISKNILAKTGIVPSHGIYTPEDCFYGQYKGAKITISEARLTSKRKKNEYAFDGIFVLIELGHEVFTGHSVITADAALARRLSKKLKPLPASKSPYARGLLTLTTAPENAEKLQNERLLKELSETMTLFDNAVLSMAFFGKRHIFLMIPYDKDMFEASDVYVPITTSDTAMRCKQEIGQIMSIIDIIDVYQGAKPAATAEADINQEITPQENAGQQDLQEETQPKTPDAPAP